MSRGPDAATLLERALHASARAAGARIAVRDWETTRWASATFTGARHRLTLVAEDDSPALRSWLGELAEAELPLRGHLVADCAVVRITCGEARVIFDIEALTVEER